MCEVCNISKCYICSKGVNTLHLHDFVQCTVIHTNKDDLKFDVYILLAATHSVHSFYISPHA